METIELNNIVPHVFDGRELHSDVWATKACFRKGHLYLVEADSGQGKSTFCSYVIGYRHDYTGTLSFDGEDVKQYKPAHWVDIRRSHISHLFQELRLFPELTAWENVAIKNQLTGFKSDQDIHQWFDQLGIADKEQSLVGLMSFGQQQRVAMIRALVQPFDFLLADEPISHLDDSNSEVMGQIMMDEAQRQGAGVIVTSIGKHMALNYEQTFKL